MRHLAIITHALHRFIRLVFKNSANGSATSDLVSQPSDSVDPFDPRRYNLWWVSWLYRFRAIAILPGHFRWFIPPIIRAFAVWLLGLEVATIGSFRSLYLSFSSSWPIYIGLCAIFFYPIGVFVLVGYAKRIKRTRDLFENGEDLGKAFSSWALRASDNVRNILWAAVLVAIVLPIGTWLWILSTSEPLASAMRFMPDMRWYSGNALDKILKILVVDIIGFIMVADTAVSFRVILCHLGFTRDMSRLPLKSPLVLPFASQRLRPISMWNAWMAANYSVGLWLVVVVFARHPSIPVFALIAIITLFTLGIVAIPQSFYRDFISRERDKAIGYLERVALGNRDSDSPNSFDISEFIRLSDALQRLQRIPVWQYDIPLTLANPVITLALAGIQLLRSNAQ